MDNNIDPNSAAGNPTTVKPGTNFAISKNIRAFITKVNNPNVKRLSGRVKISNIGLIKILISPITITAAIADVKPTNVIPGTIHAVKIKAAAKRTHFISISSISFILISIQRHYKTQKKTFHQTYGLLMNEFSYPNNHLTTSEKY